jgi:hypothetical protein
MQDFLHGSDMFLFAKKLNEFPWKSAKYGPNQSRIEWSMLRSAREIVV